MEEASGAGGPPQPVLPPSEPLDASLSDASDSGGPDKARPSSDSQDDAQAPQQGEEEEGGGERTTGVRFAIPPPPPERSESTSSTGDSTSMQPLNSPERGYRKRGQVRRTHIYSGGHNASHRAPAISFSEPTQSCQRV
jgi:hypothetical protein